MRTSTLVLAAFVLAAPSVALAQQESAAAEMPLGTKPPPKPIEIQVVGSPTWTQSRTFTTSRMWLHDPGTQALELWYTGEFRHNGVAGDNEHLWQLEYSMGVVKHVQVDVYFNVAKDEEGYHWEGTSIEGRFALPDHYGQIFANPVLYLELQQINQGPARGEARLLLGGEIVSPRLHGVLNPFVEQNLNRAQPGEPMETDREAGASAALNYFVVPDYFAFGAETKLAADQEGGESYKANFGVGPAVWASAWPGGLRLAVSGLFGLTDRSDRLRLTAVLGMRL
jgi:hypothetical protein